MVRVPPLVSSIIVTPDIPKDGLRHYNRVSAVSTATTLRVQRRNSLNRIDSVVASVAMLT